MQRFIYSASAFAIGGRFTRPIDHRIETVAPAVLPDVGGRAAARAGSFSLTAPDGEFLISWDSAETTIEGGAENNSYVTQISSIVRGVNVGNTLKVDEVSLQILVRYDKGTRKSTIDPTGSGFKGMSLGGRTFDVSIDATMGRDASDFEKFHKDHPHFPFSNGKVFYALGRNPELIFQDDDNGMLVQPNFGRIYFAEWSCGQGVQSLTMLRLKLGSPSEGEVEFGGGIPNGQSYP